MNGNRLTISNLSPFVLSRSKDSERLLQKLTGNDLNGWNFSNDWNNLNPIDYRGSR